MMAAFVGAPALSFPTFGAQAPRDGVLLGLGANSATLLRVRSQQIGCGCHSQNEQHEGPKGRVLHGSSISPLQDFDGGTEARAERRGQFVANPSFAVRGTRYLPPAIRARRKCCGTP